MAARSLLPETVLTVLRYHANNNVGALLIYLQLEPERLRIVLYMSTVQHGTRHAVWLSCVGCSLLALPLGQHRFWVLPERGHLNTIAIYKHVKREVARALVSPGAPRPGTG